MPLSLSAEDWFHPPSNPVLGRPYIPDGGVWHYTNLDGLSGILSSGAVWATSSRSLNDTSEVTFGVESVQSTWTELLPDLVPDAPRDLFEQWLAAAAARALEMEAFFVSASGLSDNLPHWNGYGQQGVAVQFDPTVEFRLRCVDDCELYTPDFVPATLWRPVTYAPVEPVWRRQQDPVIKFISSALDAFATLRGGQVRDETLFFNALEHQFLSLVCLHKSDAFEYEEEYRLLVLAPPEPTFVRTRETRFGPTPYVVLEPASELDDRDRYCSRRGAKLPVEHVRIAPSADSASTELQVRDLLAAAGYGHVGTSVSAISFR